MPLENQRFPQRPRERGAGPCVPGASWDTAGVTPGFPHILLAGVFLLHYSLCGGPGGVGPSASPRWLKP